ncbi:MAG: inositol monophosphatase [Leptospira sp.]|nr:inositol monophosphatase [Leptospira sp.]
MESETKERYIHFLNFIPKVGNYLKGVQRQPVIATAKKGLIDLVTEADTGSEKMILEEIQTHFPSDQILMEESGLHEGSGRFKWIIDPVDGTTNFRHRLPLYGIAIGLEDTLSGNVVMGIVSLPELGDIYHAAKGEGAFKNKNAIRVSETSVLLDTLFATGFPYEKEHRIDRLMNYYKSILLMTRGIRRTGAASLDLCWVAEGKFDGFWEEGLQPWDMAGPSVIIQEAGGKLSTFDGNEYTPYIPNLIASNGKIHENIIDIFRENVNLLF